ncbi:hypothetical protein Amme_009_007 [Acidomonas methanolica NBRC 104435]|uniref:Uncharacterized protein n=1 Tax=Acidomonas methanolica NBRC 104435 TaxID=1231351 RepID=A0A023D270_ACIMT|nr:hypothetical protein Amme_009_007 [Acidomonas methanolica NBRC 104435]GEK99799.1 hypothetical protein AME01nite_22980 [Acidomonas methanolica NBRC 104435]
MAFAVSLQRDKGLVAMTFTCEVEDRYRAVEIACSLPRSVKASVCVPRKLGGWMPGTSPCRTRIRREAPRGNRTGGKERFDIRTYLRRALLRVMPGVISRCGG